MRGSDFPESALDQAANPKLSSPPLLSLASEAKRSSCLLPLRKAEDLLHIRRLLQEGNFLPTAAAALILTCGGWTPADGPGRTAAAGQPRFLRPPWLGDGPRWLPRSRPVQVAAPSSPGAPLSPAFLPIALKWLWKARHSNAGRCRRLTTERNPPRRPTQGGRARDGEPPTEDLPSLSTRPPAAGCHTTAGRARLRQTNTMCVLAWRASDARRRPLRMTRAPSTDPWRLNELGPYNQGLSRQRVAEHHHSKESIKKVNTCQAGFSYQYLQGAAVYLKPPYQQIGRIYLCVCVFAVPSYLILPHFSSKKP